MKHSDKCLKMQERLKLEIAVFNTAHPNACLQCGGVGSETVYDTVDYGSTTAQMPSEEPCAECLGKGKCPLCGHQHGEEWEMEACDFCGWLYYCDEPLSRPRGMDDCDCLWENPPDREEVSA